MADPYMDICVTSVIHVFLCVLHVWNVYYMCTGFTCITSICNASVGYTPVLYVLYTCKTCSSGTPLLHMKHVLQVFYTYMTGV